MRLVVLKNVFEGFWRSVENRPLIGIAVMLCLVFALGLGVLVPTISFQKTSILLESEKEEGYSAFATNGAFLIEIPSGKNVTATAIFQGAGKLEKLVFHPKDRHRVAWLEINGKQVCRPCNSDEGYLVDQNGILEFGLCVEDEKNASRNENGGFFGGHPMFEPSKFIQRTDHVEMTVFGAWRPDKNGEIPSSFYFVDSPYHISKTNVTASYLSKGSLPQLVYPITSVVAPAAMAAFFGIGAPYAYKIYLIALFFVPVVLFYLFSRKLDKWRDSAFLFAVLLYLYLPMRVMLVGGGQDLFIDGMVARTLAIYLAMFFLYFAYEFVAERKNALILAAIFFFLSFMTHPKGLLGPGIGVGMICVYFALRKKEWVRSALLFATCCAVVLATGFDYFSVFYESGIGTVGLKGVAITDYTEGLFSFFFTSAFVLPVFFAIGFYFSLRQKNGFVIWLSVFSVAILFIATNPKINTAISSFDGLRHMPSFYLCVYFVSGVGAAGTYSYLKRRILSWVEHKNLDRLTAVGATFLAIGMPMGAILLIAISSSPEQYSAPYLDLRVAKEYVPLEKSMDVVGNERITYVYESELSHYPIGVFGVVHPPMAHTGLTDPDGLYDAMVGKKVRYVLFGNGMYDFSQNRETPRIFEKYAEFVNDSRFELLVGGGSAQLFRLVGKDDLGRLAYGRGAKISMEDVGVDYAAFSGECLESECSIIFFNSLTLNPACNNNQGPCTVKKDSGSDGWVLEGIVQGPFEVRVERQRKEIEYLLFFSGCVALLACFWLSRRII